MDFPAAVSFEAVIEVKVIVKVYPVIWHQRICILRR